MCVCVGLWWSLYFQELLLQLHDLPFALLGMIGEFDGDSEQGEAASALQTALKRHVITRCEDPRHTARTNTDPRAKIFWRSHPRFFLPGPKAPAKMVT